MRRVLLALLTAAALAVSGLTLPAAWGDTIEAVDAGVDITDLVGEISPAGSYGVYDVTVTFEGLEGAGLESADVTLTNAVTNGTIDTNYSDCAASCTLTFEESGSQTVQVAVESDTGENVKEVVITSSVALDDDVTDPADGTVIAVDNNAENDSDNVTTPVTSTSTSSAFVPEGGSLTFEANGQTHVLTVTETYGDGGGAIVTLSDPEDMDCNNDGTSDCHGVRVEFEGGDKNGDFEADTELNSSRDDKPPCQGLGAPSGCVDIFGRKAPDEDMVKLESCDTDATTRDHLCVRQVFKVDGDIHWLTALKTSDPDIGLPDVPIDV